METLLYIGTFADSDTNEGDSDAENLGVFPTTVIDNTVLQLVTVTAVDADGNGRYNDDEIVGTDPTSYDLGSGIVNTEADMSTGASITVTLGDGTTTTFNALLVQMANGDTFVGDLNNTGNFDNLNIQSIQINSYPFGSNFSGWNVGQSIDNSSVVCFACGTQILTDAGEVPVEELKVGDRIVTAKSAANDAAKIRWIDRRKVSRGELAHSPKLRPIRITTGALGHGLPRRDLFISRQHRILVTSKIAERMFGEPEILVPAIRLTELPGVFIDEDVDSVEYFHLLFDQHEIIFAEGTPSESLFTGLGALKAVSPEARDEILTLFPKIADLDYLPKLARPIPTGKKLKQFIQRHVVKGIPLMSKPLCNADQGRR